MADATGPQDTQEGAQEGVGGGGAVAVRGKHLTNGERNAILQALLARSDGKQNLDYGAIKAVAKEFKTTRQAVAGIWKRGLQSLANGARAMIVDHRKGNCGRKKKDHSQAIQAMAQIPTSQRTTIRATAHAMNVSTWAVWRMRKNSEINRVSSAVKPLLSEEHKQARIDYCIQQIDFDRMYMKRNYDVVHVDEKWFSLTQVNKTYYLAPGEETPSRATSSKRYIGKIMFLCAVARPRHDSTSNTYFDGKLGIWPFVEMVEAQRTSRNRPRGTLEMKNMNVNGTVYNDYLFNKVIPAIGQKWPQCHRNIPIRIQQDNAPAHVRARNADPAFHAAVAATGLSIVFDNQPAQSPDTNVLDLGYFNSIQSLQQKRRSNNLPELVQVVNQSFLDLDRKNLEKVFLTHQAVCKEILMADGHNNFKLPHLRKDALLRRNGSLPEALRVEDELVGKIAELRPTMFDDVEAVEV